MERIITKSFARLMGRGTHRGFITYEELNKSLGKRNLSDENLSQAFIHILDEGVALVEKKSDFKVLRKKENNSKEDGKTSRTMCCQAWSRYTSMRRWSTHISQAK